MHDKALLAYFAWNFVTTVLAFDYGKKRIGVAMGSTCIEIAHPLKTIKVKTKKDLYQEIKKLVNEWTPSIFLVGMPIKKNNLEHELFQDINGFCINLKKWFGLSVIKIDESFTSREAESRLANLGLDLAKNKEIVDSLAAAMILEDFFCSYETDNS